MTAKPSGRRRVAWMLNHYALPPSRSGGTRHYELARHASDHGWDVYVIAASTGLGSGEQILGRWRRSASTVERGVHFTWLKAPSYSGNGGKRYLNMAVFAANAWLPGASRGLPRPDVIIGSTVHPLTAVAAHRLARRYRVPFVFEVRDLCISEYGVAPEKVAWIPNGVDLSCFPHTPAPSGHEELRLLYSGAHGQANGLDMLVEGMAMVHRFDGGPRVRLAEDVLPLRSP